MQLISGLFFLLQAYLDSEDYLISILCSSVRVEGIAWDFSKIFFLGSLFCEVKLSEPLHHQTITLQSDGRANSGSFHELFIPVFGTDYRLLFLHFT